MVNVLIVAMFAMVYIIVLIVVMKIIATQRVSSFIFLDFSATMIVYF